MYRDQVYVVMTLGNNGWKLGNVYTSVNEAKADALKLQNEGQNVSVIKAPLRKRRYVQKEVKWVGQLEKATLPNTLTDMKELSVELYGLENIPLAEIDLPDRLKLPKEVEIQTDQFPFGEP